MTLVGQLSTTAIIVVHHFAGKLDGTKVELTSVFKRRNGRIPHKEDNPLLLCAIRNAVYGVDFKGRL